MDKREASIRRLKSQGKTDEEIAKLCWEETDVECFKCGLKRYGGYHYNSRMHIPDSWECRRISTHTINPDKPWGEKIELRCSKCGMTGWHTKNIEYIGARTIFWEHEEGKKECDCDVKYLEPVGKPESETGIKVFKIKMK